MGMERIVIGFCAAEGSFGSVAYKMAGALSAFNKIKHGLVLVAENRHYAPKLHTRFSRT